VPTVTTAPSEKEIDYLLNFALFLEEAERSPVTIKNYLLRRFLFFAYQGFIRQQQDENLANQSSCLTKRD
jgi:hypothetical protein